MKKIFVLIFIAFPSLLFAQAAAPLYVTYNEPQGGLIIYVSDSTDKTPLDSARIRIYDNSKEMISAGYTNSSGFDTIPIAYGKYKVTINKMHYHLHIYKVDYKYNPKDKKSYYTLNCVIGRSGIKLKMHKVEE